MVKNLPTVQEPQETWVVSLGWEDPLEKEMAIHSRVLAWEISWTEEPGGLQFMGSQSDTTEHPWFSKSNCYSEQTSASWSSHPHVTARHSGQTLILKRCVSKNDGTQTKENTFLFK